MEQHFPDCDWLKQTPARGVCDCAIRREAVERMDVKLTVHDLNALRQGARHPDGVINPMRRSNFDNPGKRMAKLVACGLATKNPHGDWYITEAGRAAITS